MKNIRELTNADLAAVAGGAEGNINIDPGGDPGISEPSDPFANPFVYP
jgi:hypothetical protein